MKVVSTSNLIPSETEKTTTVCNFQKMNSFVMSHDLNCKIHRKKTHIETKQQNQT